MNISKVTLVFALVFSMALYGQSNINFNQNTKARNWHVGGNLGLNFGNNSFFGFNASPFIAYEVSPKVDLGMMVGYQYAGDDFARSNMFSGGPFMNYHPIPEFFGRIHYEYYTGDFRNKISNTNSAIDENALWIGLGYQNTGRVRFQTGIMYNVLYDSGDSIFSSGLRPFGGVSIGL